MAAMDLPEDLYVALRRLAHAQGRPVEQLVAEVLGRFVSDHEHRARIDAASAEIVSRDATLLDRLAR